MSCPSPSSIHATFGLDFIGVIVGAAAADNSFINLQSKLMGYQLKAGVRILCYISYEGFGHYKRNIGGVGNPQILQQIVWCVPRSHASQGHCQREKIAGVFAFFARRVWILSYHNIPVISLIAVLVVAELLLHQNTLGHLVNIFAVAGDLVITVSLVYLLQASSPEVHSEAFHFFLQELMTVRTDALLNRLIIYSLNTGLLTSVCSLVCLLTVKPFPELLHVRPIYFYRFYQLVGLPKTFAFIALYTLLPHFYSISFLGSYAPLFYPSELHLKRILNYSLNSRNLNQEDSPEAPILISSVRWGRDLTTTQEIRGSLQSSEILQSSFPTADSNSDVKPPA
ncbi:hypothetical protein R3P38DRAFT_2808149 [Favolaschia claudopus]|uniref:DUF6534 domain-containing protein n=1 Tax=Favolaschia claudopus TaxID=2862362 RepID=A0AAV9ZGW2_9AGAR